VEKSVMDRLSLGLVFYTDLDLLSGGPSLSGGLFTEEFDDPFTDLHSDSFHLHHLCYSVSE